MLSVVPWSVPGSQGFPRGPRCEQRDRFGEDEAAVDHNPVEMRMMLNAPQSVIDDAIAESQALDQVAKQEGNAELPAQRAAVVLLDRL